MKGTGLTHGGFYGHFRSKDQLAAEAVTRALERSTKRQSHFTDLNDVVSDYLSERHRTDRANGCAIAALGPEMARQGEDMRRGVTTHVRAQLDRFSQLLRGGTAASRRECAIATLAGIIGALMLARAVEGSLLSEEFFPRRETLLGKAQPSSQSDNRLTPPGPIFTPAAASWLDPRSAASHLRRHWQLVRCQITNRA